MRSTKKGTSVIKARLTTEDGRGVLILGLSEGNIQQLKAGKPIMFDASAFGVDGEVYIMYGKTELDICNELKLPVPQ
jgi:hypothetical protein